jgi:sec-independent protein translocase protein TatA
MIGTQNIILLVIIIVVLFGATRLPKAGSGLGKGIRNFKKAMSEPETADATPKKDDAKKEKKSNSED